MEDLLQRAAGDLVKARYGIALTGAGISTESGTLTFEGQTAFGPRILMLK